MEEQQERLESGRSQAAAGASEQGNGAAQMDEEENPGALEHEKEGNGAGQEQEIDGAADAFGEDAAKSGKSAAMALEDENLRLSCRDDGRGAAAAEEHGKDLEGQDGKEGIVSDVSAAKMEKTELEREMELFEASVQEEEANMLSQVNEKKRAHEQTAQESRKKRGRKASVKASFRKEEDDVCFMCFDGGDLILCDQRTCPKAYHIACIGRDQEFFRKKGNWLCGWHFCSGENCSKKATFRCHTCPKAYCAGCRNQYSFLLLENRKGLCDECVPYVKMIENKETVNQDGGPVDLNDRETYECLFKEYWEDLKAKESIKIPELDKDGKFLTATPAPESDVRSDNESSSSESEETTAVEMADDEDVPLGTGKRKERKTKVLNALSDEIKCTINQEQKTDDVDENYGDEEDEEQEEEEEEEEGDAYRPTVFDGWASKELISFLKFMKEDTKTPMKRFAVNKLLWDHIKANKLQNPRKKTIIRCDEQLRSLFGKKAVTQRGMMKYLHFHFPSKASKAVSGGQANETENLADADDEKAKKNKKRTKAEEFAAINQNNISHLYLRRSLLEDMLGDPNFEDKVSGTFVRIRVPGTVGKNEMCYRLVQVVGTKVQAEEYKTGKKTTKIVLLIMNLHKKEDLTIDLVSNQDFTEEECSRLRQSIRWGFIPAPTVGDFERKAFSIREAKLNDMFETETSKLTALRDRANEKGRKKELRECVEKLQRLSNPDYRIRELSKVPTFEADHTMDPEYEDPSEDDPSPAEEPADTDSHAEKEKSRTFREEKEKQPNKWDRRIDPPAFSKQDSFKKDSFDKGWDHKKDSFDKGWDQGFSQKKDSWDHGFSQKKDSFEKGWDQGFGQRKDNFEKGRDHTSSQKRDSFEKGWEHDYDKKHDYDWQNDGKSNGKYGSQKNAGVTEQKEHTFASRPPPPPPPRPPALSTPPINVNPSPPRDLVEKEKAWFYQDPRGTNQGPFSFEQLRRWKLTGLFPPDLRVWRAGQLQEQGILLVDALASLPASPTWANHPPPPPDTGRPWDTGTRTGGWTSSSSSRDWNGGHERVVVATAAPAQSDPWSQTPGRSDSSYGNDGWATPQAQHRSPGWRDPAPPSGGWNERESGSFRSPRIPSQHGSKKGTPCRFYQKGFCRNGESCPFQHN